eukprot:gene1196-biopygen1089
MQSLFTPFRQAQRLAGGTGLGLFSLSRRVDAIGGRYGVMKRPDGKQGSVFWFEIPYKPDSEYAKNMTQLAVSRSSSKSTPRISVHKTVRRTSLLLSARKADSLFVRSTSPVNFPKSLKILLVDDTLSIQKMTSMLLKKQGHTVTVAENGVVALELITIDYFDRAQDAAKGPRFDIVLMDFQMPIMDGLETTRRIRA